MRKIRDVLKAIQPVHGLLLFLVAIMGVIGTFAIGRHIEEAAFESWIRQAELDVSVATTTAQGWLAQSETIIGGLAVGFRGPDLITNEEFEALVQRAADWNSEFSLDAVAIVRRVLRPQRGQVEQDLKRELSSASSQTETVPDAFAHMVVVTSTEVEGPLRVAVDLLTEPKMGIVATTAQRVPDKAILGPAFTVGDGRLYSLVGISLPRRGRNLVVVGLVNLSDMIEAVLANYVPQGLVLRLSERETETGSATKLQPIFGPLQAGNDALHTVTVRVTRGQARWNYNWDVTADYLGGAPTANATMVQIGGLIVTVLVVYTIGLLSLQNALIKIKVEEQTRELQRTKDILLESHNHLEDLVAQRTHELEASLKSEMELKGKAEQASQAKSDFLAAMSHELRTPLNAIMGFSHLMRTSALGPLGAPQYEEYANDIYYSGTLLLSLIDDVLDISKVEAGKYDLANEPLNIASQIDVSFRQLSLAAEASDRTLASEIPPDFPALRGDERALIQILNNLLSNALKFTPDGGRIVVEAMVDEGNGIVLSVTDTGAGMSDEDIVKALRPFEQVDRSSSRSREGTGLGLHLSAKIMTLLGGALTITSKVGEGTRVTLTFPPERTG